LIITIFLSLQSRDPNYRSMIFNFKSPNHSINLKKKSFDLIAHLSRPLNILGSSISSFLLINLNESLNFTQFLELIIFSFLPQFNFFINLSYSDQFLIYLPRFKDFVPPLETSWYIIFDLQILI